MKRLIIIAGLLLGMPVLVNAQIKVSLLVDDNYGLIMNRAIEEIRQNNPSLKNTCEIRTLTYSRYPDSELSFVEQSGLIFVYTHNPKVFEQAKPQLLKAVRAGGHVYVLNSSAADEEYQKMGVRFDSKILHYFKAQGKGNIRNMILYGLHKDFAIDCDYTDVHTYPKSGIYDYVHDTIYTDVSAFIKSYPAYQEGNPWIGMVVGKHDLLMGQSGYFKTHIRYIENESFNVLPVYGYPATEAIKNFFLDQSGKSRVKAIIAISLWHGVRPDDLRKTFQETGVPVINCIQIPESQDEWEKSSTGISIFNRANFLAQPELTGQIQPTVTACREPGAGTDNDLLQKTAINKQVRKMVNRMKAWYALQTKPNQEKQVALIYYSYPPGKENIGASYLNVLPQSIFQILQRMKTDGYDLGSRVIHPDTLYRQVMTCGRNVGNWAPAEVARLVSTGEPVLVPASLYKTWYQQLSPSFRAEVEAKWGIPDTCSVMTWKNRKKKLFFVIPAVRYGNTLLTAQPLRGWGQDPSKMYHDVHLPPHHQYIAFYLYLKNSFRADALIHLGTHGTHEWLSGKEAGLNDDDAPEALISDLVNIYPYIIDDVGEGLQAKRRGMAVIVDHMTPPFDRAGLNPEMKELAGLISDYEVAKGKSEALAVSKLATIKEKAGKLGLLKDLGITVLDTDDDLSRIEHYIKEVSEKQTPFGLHTFGKAPDSAYTQSTAKAIASRQKGLSAAKVKQFTNEIKNRLEASAPRELNSLMDALDGKYIPAGKGNDPLRNPASLPSGKNFYAFDPALIPAKSTCETGSRLAEELVDDYRSKHDGKYPEKITMNLWSTECIRHEGIMEAQILKLMGVKPVWDGYGKVKGVELIPSALLKRPRIDVVIVPSGLYRDLFSNLMNLLDEAVQLVLKQDETDNYIREHILATKKMLIQEGVTDEKLAERLASVRMFSVPSGAYGTGTANVIGASGTWDNEEQVSQVYFNRMSHLYGQGFWGTKAEDLNASMPEGLSLRLFKKSLSGTNVVVHSRSSNVFGALDNDDFFQYLGSTAMAVRSVDGKTPDVIVTNLSDPANVAQETLDKYIGREMKTRYLNPKWINKMLDEGYAGARFINKVVFNLWGWQVTVPEAIDENKWMQVYETYVEDKYQLDIKEKFRKAENMYAYQTMLSRMIETVRKGYWHADRKTLETMVKEFNSTVEEVGLSCNENVCNNTPLSDYLLKELSLVPGADRQKVVQYKKALNDLKKVNIREQAVPSPEKQIAKDQPSSAESYMPKKQVKGYEMEEVVSPDKRSKNDKTLKISLLILIGLFALALIMKRMDWF